MTAEATFEGWLAGQAKASAAGLALGISATGLTYRRTGFGQVVAPRPGSVLASPETRPGPGEPDYFFHWLRDSALIMSAALELARQGDASADWRRSFRDFVEFSRALAALDGRCLPPPAAREAATEPALRQFLRPAEELAAIHGETVPGDVRYNADGTLDTIRWGRPQHDGPALRALACLEALALGLVEEDAKATTERLLRGDLDYVARHAGIPGYDIWEEALGFHYYTRIVQLAALRRGAAWAAARQRRVPAWRAAAAALARQLDAHWSADPGGYLPRAPAGEAPPDRTLDMAVILGVLHAGLPGPRHSPRDPRVHATLARLEARFAADYPLNRARPAGLGVAMGRYPGDRYVVGGPWYLCSFAAAELRYRAAVLRPGRAARLIEAGDASLAMVRRSIPADGALAEQFDPVAGRPASARDLGWSHAGFLTALWARRRALDAATRR